jgi:hypothetical protein
MRIKVKQEKLKLRDHLGDLVIDIKIILRMIRHELYMRTGRSFPWRKADGA